MLQVGRHVIDGAGAAVDDAQLLLEIHAHARDERFRRRVRRLVEHSVGGVEHLAEEVELLGKDLEREALRNVAGCQEADDGDAALLAVAVDAADALLDALRVPRQVVVDDRVAELEVQALGAGFGRDEDLRSVSELVDKRQPDGDARGSGDAPGQSRDPRPPPIAPALARHPVRRCRRETA